MDKSPSFQLKFLDEYIIPAKTIFEQEEIGGLSGIDFQNDTLVLLDDRSNQPSVYHALWKTNDLQIDSLVFIKSLRLKKTDTLFQAMALDLESIRWGMEDEYWLSSEGNINATKNPSIFQLDKNGKLKTQLQLPSYFLTADENRPMHNGVFEGLTWDFDKKYLWAATELPLALDGKQPQLWNTFSPIRFTKYNPTTGEAEQQFIYLLDRIVRIPLLPFYINGVTEIISFSKDEFLVLERSYSAGRGKHANRVKLFLAHYPEATNTLDAEQIHKKDEYIPAKKKLVFDFKKIRKLLPSKRIDNLEGMCFGPQLANGNASLLFVSDNNFNSFGEQLTQIIWMEVIQP